MLHFQKDGVGVKTPQYQIQFLKGTKNVNCVKEDGACLQPLKRLGY